MTEIWDTVPGGPATIIGLASIVATVLTLAVTKKPWLALLAGFGTCWIFPITGVAPIWGAIVCSIGVASFVALWRLWLRD